MTQSKNLHLHKKILSEWQVAVADGNFERAIMLDAYHYNELVKKNEDVKFWDLWQAETLYARKKLLHLIVKKEGKKNQKIKPKRVAIIYHNYSGLAHEEQLARNLIYYKKNIEKIECHIVYLFGPRNIGKVKTLFEVQDNCVHFLEAESYENASNKLNHLVNYIGFSNIIYPSIFYLAYWMSIFLDHDNQKFLQMKYYPLCAGRIKGWAGGQRNANRFYKIKECEFLQLPILDIQVNDYSNGGLNYKTENNLINKNFGSISRSEKISNIEYNNFILKILKKLKNWNYLYAGKPETIQLIPLEVRNHEKAKFIGWVEPIDVINEYTIYLEPFPWGGGDMTLLALQHGCPYLTLETDENNTFGILPFLKIIAKNGNEIMNFSFCKNKSELEERIILLANDDELREKLGIAWQQAIVEYKPTMINNWTEFLIK
jgi:hypothetical protein